MSPPEAGMKQGVQRSGDKNAVTRRNVWEARDQTGATRPASIYVVIRDGRQMRRIWSQSEDIRYLHIHTKQKWQKTGGWNILVSTGNQVIKLSKGPEKEYYFRIPLT